MFNYRSVIELGREILFVLDSIKSKLCDLEDILLEMNEDDQGEVGGIW